MRIAQEGEEGRLSGKESEGNGCELSEMGGRES